MNGRDKKKDLASNYAAYYPFGVDVFLSQRKIEHIARFVELPVISNSRKFPPPILVVNVQVFLILQLDIHHLYLKEKMLLSMLSLSLVTL